MSERTVQMEKLLNQSLHAVRDYEHLIRSHEADAEAPISRIGQKQQKVLQNLLNSLQTMRSFLSEEIKEDRVTHLDPRLLTSMNKAFEGLMKDETMENKINFVHFALYGANVPFWTVLREVQNLLHTVEDLRGKSKKIAKIDDLEADKDKKRDQ